MARAVVEMFDPLVQRSLEERSDVFGNFYRPFVEYGAKQIGELLTEVESDSIDSTTVGEGLVRSIAEALTTVGTRALITAFRSQLADPSSRNLGYQAFHRWISEEQGRDWLLGRFPELDRLLRLQVDNRVGLAADVLRAIQQDLHILKDSFGAGQYVTDITPGVGDPHRGGRTVCFVRWSNGTTVVYKPQRQSCHQLIQSLQSLLDPDRSYFGPLTPRTVVQTEHLWQEHVEPAPVDETLGTCGYFRRFGRAAALFSMLGTTDLHHENVISTAQGPVVIDTETLVSIPQMPLSQSTGKLTGDIAHSVLNTMLFPTRYRGSRLDVDLSGIGCIQSDHSKEISSFTVVGQGTDSIRFDQSPVAIQHGANIAKHNGEPLDPRLFIDDVVIGFDEAREWLRSRRATIERVLQESKGWSVRHVVRPTYIYARFLEASTHPAYLGSRADRAALLARLPHRYHGVTARPDTDHLHDWELTSLLDLDIPFFDVTADAEVLRNNGEPAGCGPVRLSCTPRQSTMAAVDAFFSRPASRDIAYIGYALSCSVDDVWDRRLKPNRHRMADRGLDPDLAHPKVWHERLADLKVEKEPTWLMPLLDGEGMRLGAVNAALHDGGGLLLYLAEAHAPDHGVFGCDLGEIYRTARPAELAMDTEPANWSPFTGSLSTVATGLELQRRGISADLPRLVPQQNARFDVDSLSEADFDYLNGLCGYLCYLAEYPTVPEADWGEARLLLHRLVSVDGAPQEHTGALGLTHGRFGRLVAMSGFVRSGPDDVPAVRAHLEGFAEAYLRHRWTDRGLRDERSRATWCKGYTGVAYGLVKILRAIGLTSAEVRDAVTPEVDRILAEPIGEDISFCHGLAGRVAMLCWLADRLDWPELRTMATSLSSRFVDRHADGGWRYGIASVAELPSFLFGLSGWYFSQLMIREDRVQLPLCLGGR